MSLNEDRLRCASQRNGQVGWLVVGGWSPESYFIEFSLAPCACALSRVRLVRIHVQSATFIHHGSRPLFFPLTGEYLSACNPLRCRDPLRLSIPVTSNDPRILRIVSPGAKPSCLLALRPC